MKVVRNKRKVSKNVEAGVAHIRSTFNNTIVTISDLNGSVLSWADLVTAYFRGSRKTTLFLCSKWQFGTSFQGQL